MVDLVPGGAASLPVPSKEKITRWVAHGAVAALGVAAIIKFMPYVNTALGLLLTGFFSVIQLALLTAGILAGTFAFINLWPVYKKFIESVSNKATWALFEYDPITPMQLWLKEVRSDLDELEHQYQEVGAVISQNESTVQDNLRKASDADKRFAQAVQRFGQDSHEAEMMAIEPGTLRETAQRIQDNTKALYTVRDILKEIVEATEFTEKKATYDVQAFEQEYSAAQSVTRATNAASHTLSRTQRKQDAMRAMQIIHDQYAGSFGRLQGLRQLSQEVITSVDMTKGTYHQEALERLKAESRMITGAKSPPVLDAIPAEKSNGVSLYKVPVSNSHISPPQ